MDELRRRKSTMQLREDAIFGMKVSSIIGALKTKAYLDNTEKKMEVIETLRKLAHFKPIRDEFAFTDMLEEVLDTMEYTFVPKGTFLFHYGDVGEKADVLVPLPSKEIYKQVKSYELRAHWNNEIDKPELSKREREIAKLNYHRARNKIIRFQDANKHSKFHKMLHERAPVDKRLLNRYFHKQYPTLGLYKCVNTLTTNSFFGEISVINYKLRTASIFADEDLHLLYLRGADYNRIFANFTHRLHFILKHMQSYLETVSKRQLIQLSYLFDPHSISFSLNQTIFKENQEKQYFYLIKSGQITFKSGRGIGLGITGEGEFFGFETLKQQSSTDAITPSTSVQTIAPSLHDRYLFSASSIENNTTLYLLSIQCLLAEDDLLSVVKELSSKGAIKAEYYAKRAQHCQNIFNQTDVAFLIKQQSQQPSSTPSQPGPDAPSLATIAYQKQKNLRSLIQSFNIERKFVNYIQADIIQSSNSNSSNTNQINSNPLDLVLKPAVSITQPIDTLEDPFKKPTPSSIEQSIKKSPQLLTLPVSEFDPHNMSQSASVLPTVTDPPRLITSASATSPDSHAPQHSFQFISQEEFELTKSMIAKEMEKQKNPPRKAQLYLPSEIADIPLSQHIANRYQNSASSRFSITNYNTNNNNNPSSLHQVSQLIPSAQSLTSIQADENQQLDYQLTSHPSLSLHTQVSNLRPKMIHRQGLNLNQFQMRPNNSGHDLSHAFSRIEVPALKITSIVRDTANFPVSRRQNHLRLSKEIPQNVDSPNRSNIQSASSPSTSANNSRIQDHTQKIPLPSMFSPRSTRKTHSISSSEKKPQIYISKSANDLFKAEGYNSSSKKKLSSHGTIGEERVRQSLQLAITDLNSPQNNRPSLTQSSWMHFPDHLKIKSSDKHGVDDSLSPQQYTRNTVYSQLFRRSCQTKQLKKHVKIKPLVLVDRDQQDQLAFTMGSFQKTKYPY